MGLSYHYSFRASADVIADSLMSFLRDVETEAREMGFSPTVVINGSFDTPERMDIARRAARGRTVDDPRLRNVELSPNSCWRHSPDRGLCLLAPRQGVLLVVTDELGRESVFGFFRYPTVIHDSAGRELMSMAAADNWISSGCVDSSDPRYRALVQRFRDAGWLESEHDEFVSACNTTVEMHSTGESV